MGWGSIVAPAEAKRHLTETNGSTKCIYETPTIKLTNHPMVTGQRYGLLDFMESHLPSFIPLKRCTNSEVSISPGGTLFSYSQLVMAVSALPEGIPSFLFLKQLGSWSATTKWLYHVSTVYIACCCLLFPFLCHSGFFASFGLLSTPFLFSLPGQFLVRWLLPNWLLVFKWQSDETWICSSFVLIYKDLLSGNA